jgi:hypothetical protein
MPSITPPHDYFQGGKMKKIACAILLVSLSAVAEVPSIKASKMTCQELKDTVEKYGAVIVKKKTLGVFTSSKYVPKKATCTAEQTLRNFLFKTLDTKTCTVGEWCEDPYVPSTIDHDFPDHDWDHDFPDHDSDRGPSYDPPDHDYEGPHYCPGC